MRVRHVGGVDGAVEPEVRDGHAVLSERARLVRADGRRGAERLDRFQVLHQTVLLRHRFRSQRQAHLLQFHKRTLTNNKAICELEMFWSKPAAKPTRPLQIMAQK